MKNKNVMLIGNSDGIGFEVTKKLLNLRYNIFGISRSNSTIKHEQYNHSIIDVTSEEYPKKLTTLLNEYKIDLCIFFVGIGEFIEDYKDLKNQTKVFEVNLLSAVKTTELVIGKMVENNCGHFIGLSSISDLGPSKDAPSYSASKSALSNYWEGLALGLDKTQVKITNVRFGFVDTKMAKSKVKPLMISKEKAANYILSVIEKPRVRFTRPIRMNLILWMMTTLTRIKVLFKKY